MCQRPSAYAIQGHYKHDFFVEWLPLGKIDFLLRGGRKEAAEPFEIDTVLLSQQPR
jgi:hypothetical protein